MRVLLINPPYQTLTSTLGVGHQVPLGLLMVGGPLLDAGHDVRLLDAEVGRLDLETIVEEVRSFAPDVVMSGHAGSTPAHTTCVAMFNAIRDAAPLVTTVYGGVYPTYHPEAILAEHASVDVVVRGEGEATALALVETLARRGRLDGVDGISFRDATGIRSTNDRAPIADLDEMRTAWELIDDWDAYQCFGLGRAAIMQFSRGCPHRCTYCGQHGFWVRWRHRDPIGFVDEIETLHRAHDVRFITLADENPTTSKKLWRQVLEELARRELPVRLFATMRATDIVRDADIMDLYRRAGILYVLMGIESTDETVLEQVKKRSTPREDFRACALLREHGIHSIIGHIVGLGNETWRGFRRARRVLAAYDGDYLNAMYVTPHSWTEFADAQADRDVVQRDQLLWDYRHQILDEPHMSPWAVFVAVKWMELVFHLRPRRLWRLLVAGGRERRRHAMWCQLHTGAVWVGEILEFVSGWRPRRRGARPLSRVAPRQPATVPLTVSIESTGRTRDLTPV